MHISNIDSLKAWLIKHLSPICEADPNPLAKYVLALIKKDKEIDELRSICLDQLDVFLQENTTDFVEKLFVALTDGSYQEEIQHDTNGASVNRRSSHETAGSAERKRKVKGSKGDSPEHSSSQAKVQRKDRVPSPITMEGNEFDSKKEEPPSNIVPAAVGDAGPHQKSSQLSLTSRSRRERYGGDSSGPPTHHHQQQHLPPVQQSFFPPVPPPALPYSTYPSPQQNYAQPPMYSTGAKPRCMQYETQGMCLLGASCPYDHGPNPIEVPAAPPPFYPNNNVASNSIMPPPSGAPMSIMTTSNCVDAPIMSTMPAQPRRSNIIPLGGGDDSSAHRVPKSSSSTVLELRRVPLHQNDSTVLTEHFSKFGTVVDIVTNFDNDPESALITFATPAEAKAAYKSPEPILQNRFIRIFFHNPQNPQSQLQRSVHDRLGGRKQRRDKFATEYDKFDSNSDDESVEMAAARKFNKAALSWTPESSQKQAAPKVDPVKQAEENAQAALERKAESEKILEQQRVAMERMKAQRELRAKLIQMLKTCKENQTALANLFSKAKDAKERHKIAETMKPINGQIRDLEGQLGLVNAGSPALRDMQREMLDLELEIYQKDGIQPVVEQRKRLAELKKQIAMRAPPPPRAPVAPGGIRPGGPPGLPAFNQTKLDKRTKVLVINGFDPEQTDELLRYVTSHFSVRIAASAVSPDSRGLQMEFASRQEAELVMARFRNFQERPVKCEWTEKMIKPDDSSDILTNQEQPVAAAVESS